ncbi:c-type cytochrome [Hymenobacter persicinus]|uniref:C-type cytochrome n=2 Tax=Hymenobacter persicinus TaxID=2025506 RepID=A0A4Q5LF47_9BACT|nr:c-type cytochrome [Hymenobacter persicinus]
MVLVLGVIGAVLYRSLDWLQTPPAQLALSNEVPAAAATDTLPAPAAARPEQLKAIAAGDALFKGNCAQCHAVNDVVVGPALAGITKRRPLSWLVPWVKNSGKVVASGDEYAVKIFAQFQKQQMPSFQLSARQIEDIMAYIESEEGRATAVAGVVALRD